MTIDRQAVEELARRRRQVALLEDRMRRDAAYVEARCKQQPSDPVTPYLLDLIAQRMQVLGDSRRAALEFEISTLLFGAPLDD